MRSVALLLIVALLAGCASVDTPSPAGADSQQASGIGQDLARGWAADAQLSGILGVEPGNDTDLRDEFPNAQAPADYEHGDGRAMVWALNFTSNTRNQTLYLLLDGTGNELDRDIENGTQQRLPAYRYDSVAAARVLHDEVAQFTQRMTDGAPLFYGLFTEGDAPVWMFTEFSMAYCLHVVSADNLTLLETECTDLTFQSEIAEQGTAEGTLTAAQTQQTHVVQTLNPHQEIHFAVRLDRGVPMGSVTMTVIAPDGSAISIGTTPDPVALEVIRVSLPASQPATWSVQVDMEGGVAQGYDLYWCTSGLAGVAGPFGGETPCSISRP